MPKTCMPPDLCILTKKHTFVCEFHIKHEFQYNNHN